MTLVLHFPKIRDLIPKGYEIYCGLVGALIRPKDRPLGSSSKILNNYDRPLVRKLASLPWLQLSMKNRREVVLPLQTCGPLVYPRVTCSLWITIYVGFFTLLAIFFLSLLTFCKADGLLPELGDIFQNQHQSSDIPDHHLDNTVPTEGMKVPEVMYTPTPSTNIISASQSTEHLNVIGDGYSPSSPVDDTIAMMQTERRYRLSLTHDYHPSRMSI